MATSAQQSQQSSSAAPKTRLGLSLSERIKVIEARQMGKSMRQLAAQFGCGKTQILNTLAQKERYIREWEVMGRNNPSIGARKRFRHTRNEQINRSVHEWYQQQAANGLRITGPMLQKQARHYAAHLGIINFAASNGWLANFRRFYNIISCSPHPRKRKTTTILPEKNGDDPQASTSKYQNDADFVPVEESVTRSKKLQSKEFLEKDPLLEDDQKVTVPNIKSEPTSDDEDKNDRFSSTKNNLDSMSTCSLWQQSSSVEESQLASKLESYHFRKEGPKPNITSSHVNHRKRRLLQLDLEQTSSKSLEHIASVEVVGRAEERRLPKLHPISPHKMYFTELLNLARSKGLLTVMVKDDSGNDWAEIRHPIAFYRVPNYGYPSHLSRLLVDSSLEYYLDVLGQCVQKGSLTFKDNSNSFNYPEATSILGALSGDYTVCEGVELLSQRVANMHMKTIQDFGNSENMYATLPDYRFRSYDCNIWIDSRIGTKCLPCKLASSDLLSTPMDLRCSSSNLHHEH